MLIFSQDRKKVVDCVNVGVTKNFGGGKEAKFCIIGSAGFGTNGILATYADEKTAMDELEKLFAAFSEGAVSYRL